MTQMVSRFINVHECDPKPFGRGGSAYVHMCRIEGGMRCALKVSMPHVLDARFAPAQWAEAHIQHQLGIDNPCVPRVYGVTTYGDVAMELCRYGDLRARMVRRPSSPFRPPFALRLIVRIAECLHRIHKKGWMHGDVKSANILMSADSKGISPRLGDFGHADVLGGRFDDRYLGQRTHMSHHSPFRVAAPEVDLYGVCVMCLELLLWRPIDFRAELEAVLDPARPVDVWHGCFASHPELAGALLDLVLPRLREDTLGDVPSFIAAVKGLVSTHLATTDHTRATP